MSSPLARPVLEANGAHWLRPIRAYEPTAYPASDAIQCPNRMFRCSAVIELLSRWRSRASAPPTGQRRGLFRDYRSTQPKIVVHRSDYVSSTTRKVYASEFIISGILDLIPSRLSARRSRPLNSPEASLARNTAKSVHTFSGAAPASP